MNAFTSKETEERIDSIVDQQVQEIGIPNNEDTTFEDATIITEYPEKRTETSKTFLMSDGTFLAASYDQPIHYKDDLGLWQDIDNTLSVTDAKAPETSQRLINKAGRTSISLEKVIKPKGFVTLKTGKHSISWGLDGAEKARSELVAQETPSYESHNDQFLRLKKLSHEVLYRDALPNVDVQYLISASSVKENIILKSRDAQKKLTETYQIGSLIPKQTSDQTIALYEAEDAEQKNPVYTIKAPSMTDSEGVISSAVSLRIVKQEPEALQIEIAPDEEWLNDSARVYPVTIDPTIGSGGAVRDTFVSSGAPNNNFGYMGSMYIGNETVTYKTCRILMDFDLPKMDKGDMVVQAQMNLVQFKNGMDPSTGSMLINAYEMGSAWNEHSDTWNNTLSAVELSMSGPILDYAATSQSTNEKVVSWDITKLVKGWYDGSRGHRGVLLVANNESAAVRNQFYSSDYPSGTGLYPTLTIRYVNQTGLQEFWSYHEQSVGRAGAGHINDYTGNLVFTIPLTGTTGELMPLNYGLVFNSSMSGTQFKDGKRGGTFGMGFQSNLSQRIDSTAESNATNDAEKEKFRLLTAAGYKYLYLDEDGTEHFFVSDPSNSSRYMDEDGYDMILTTGGSTDEYYTLSYQDGSKKTFTQSGYFRKIYDKNGNALTLAYSGARLSTITDGAGRITTLGYTSFGNLDSITTPDGKQTLLRYDTDNKLLTSITFFDGKITRYAYNSGNLLTSATDIDGSRMEYTYELNGSDWMIRNRVTSAKEYSESGEIGNTVKMTYKIDNTTDFQYISALGKQQNETYSFDRYGRAVSVVNADGSASAYGYTANPQNIPQRNKISAQAATIRPVVNLLTNHSAELTESPPSWTLYRQGTSTGQMTIASDNAFLGVKSLKVTQTQSGTGMVGARQVKTDLVPGDTYTFSAYVKTEGVSDGFANLFVQAIGDNPAEFIGQGGINGTSSASSSLPDGWNRISLTFTVPAGTTEVALNAGLIGATGTAWFDCLQLETGNVANLYNMLENSSLKYTSGAPSYIPINWVGNELESGDRTYGKEMYIKGNPTKNKSLSQKIPINKPAETIAFVMSGKARGNSIPTDAALGRYFALDLGLFFTDGTKQWTVVPFNPDSSGEQYTTGPVYTLEGNLKKIIERVEFYIIYYKNANSAYFYDVQLNLDETGSTFAYDQNGQPITSRQNAFNNETYQYTNAKELLLAKQRNDDSYGYFYGDQNGQGNLHRLRSAQSKQTKIGMYYSYDGKGNVIDTKMGIINDSGEINTTVSANPYLQTTQGYSSNGNYRTSVSDQRGNITTYSIDTITGLINSVTDSKGYQTSYTYDPDNYFLTEVSALSGAGTVTVSYEYDEADLLSKITHNGFDYYFGYDGFGNTVNIKVGTKNLITHVYETGNGNLLYSLYGNNYKISYGYDPYNRVISVQKNNAPTYQYDYDARGNLARVTDTPEATPKITNFFYDMADRLVRKTFGVDTEIRQRYDNMNRIISQYFRFKNQTRLTSFTYTVDNRKKETNLLSGGKMTFSYDTLNRIFITDVNHVASTDPTLRTQVEFVNLPAGNRTTTLTKNHFNYKRVGNTNVATLSSCAYTYDNNGNISTVTDAAGNLTTYTYDQLNQLVRVDDQKAGNTITYDYDVGGNITRVRYYLYSTGQPGNAFLNVSYFYDNDNWKDLLTSYDGQSITYDQIGNPLTYRDGMNFTWAGRQMATATVNGESISYTYNSDGIRTSKTVDGVTTDYLVDGSTIVAQNTVYDTLWFMYDSDGTRVGFTYHDDAYYYMKNAQGDVTGIVDSNLNVVVEYSYDAWGKLIETTGSEANLIGKLNPFLYRGYYYDAETGLYYLNSRYYDPIIGRWINADSVLNNDILGNNFFIYCGNNPTSRTDDNGAGFWIIAGAIIGGAISGITKAATNVMSGNQWNEGIIGAVIGGAVAGAIVAATGGAALPSFIASYSGATAESIVNQVLSYTPIAKINGSQKVSISKKNIVNSVKKVATDTVVSGTMAAVTGKIAGNIVPTNPGWFPPRKFVSSFTGKYAVKVELQGLAQGSAQFTAEGIILSVRQRINTGQQPTVSIFDHEIRAAR